VNPSTIAAVIASSYGGLLLAWPATLPLARRSFRRQAAIRLPGRESLPPQTVSPAAAAGTLAVFLANIRTMGLFLFAAVRPDAEHWLDAARIPLPAGIQLDGAALFLLNGVWGLLVMIFHPAYTPFFLKRERRIFLATRGPYALVRHPRYPSEAALNIILFLFAGTWIPLPGIPAWFALHRQALREEEFLPAAAPEAYGRYMAATGRFLPRWRSLPGKRRGNGS
jgi:protein-S-isoprenylcysteine O-methyltransferase Ste14